jgi:DUF1680 family protein
MANAKASGARLSPVSPAAVRFDNSFWGPRLEKNRTITLSTSYNHLKKAGNLTAYQWDWVDPKKTPNPPWKIWVGDLPKWLEACAYSLAAHPDKRLAGLVSDAVTEIARGQKPDGYLYANPLPRAWRYRNLAEWHELYDLGHMIEGAVALAQCTGDRRLLDVVVRAVRHVEKRFGTKKGQIRAGDGHPEIELALMRLYRFTGDPAHLALAAFFVDIRGRDPGYYDAEYASNTSRGIRSWGWFRKNPAYAQADMPIRDQQVVNGHAVRALYFLAGAADVAAASRDASLRRACLRLWKNVTRRRMYVTGGVGSTPQGEAFTYDFDLPNESAYAETCASIALVFFAHRLLHMEPDAEFADVIERALYNGILSGVSLDGSRFFYSNRLTVYPKVMQKETDHRKPNRQEWFGCACCPPNLARLLASLGSYVCSTGPGALWIHLYAGGTLTAAIDGHPVTVETSTRYPWDGDIQMTVKTGVPATFTLALRIPGWARSFRLAVNGKPCTARPVKGYVHLTRQWAAGDRIHLVLPMPVERLEAHPSVREDAGLVALQRGPMVYAFESLDNGPELADLALPRDAAFKIRPNKALQAPELVTRGYRRSLADWDDRLYRPLQKSEKRITLTAIPYALWNNRGEGEMRVWVRDLPVSQ